MNVFNKDNAMLIIIDMNYGFAKEGALYSPNVEELIEPISKLMKSFSSQRIPMLHYTDNHHEDDEEFKIFPKHCLNGTKEAEIVEELLMNNVYIVKKTTTNGFRQLNPFKVIPLRQRDVYVCGCVTDICIKNFVISTIAYLKKFNLANKVCVFEDLVATYDSPEHPAKEFHAQAIKEMADKGAVIIKYQE